MMNMAAAAAAAYCGGAHRMYKSQGSIVGETRTVAIQGLLD
jgi:hypothetical protein